MTVHQEACVPLSETIDKIHQRGKKAGVAIKPHTGIESLVPYFGQADMFLVMTVEPGFGGQKYMEMCTDKIRNLRNMLSDRGLDTDIQVDGGITRDNVTTVINAGANVIVMGSSIFDGNVEENTAYFSKLFKQYQ